MEINHTGKIIDDFYIVGNIDVPVYLLDCPVPLIFDSGFTTLRHHYARDIKEILGNRHPGFLFLTHSHWDHIGSASYFKKLWRGIKIIGSARISHILKQESALQQINALNLDAIRTLESWGITDISREPFEPFELDIELEERSEIKVCGNMIVHAIPTPGHTWDSFSYWIPSRSILVASEAVLCDNVCEFLVDIDAYFQSLEKLKQLEVKVLCTGHRSVIIGKEAKEYIGLSAKHAQRYVHMVQEILKEENFDVERTVQRVKAVEWDPKPLPKQPEKAYLINTRIRVQKVLEHMHKA